MRIAPKELLAGMIEEVLIQANEGVDAQRAEVGRWFFQPASSMPFNTAFALNCAM